MVDFYLYFIAATGIIVLVLIFVKFFSKPKEYVSTSADEFTVIIPFRNEENDLRLLIESLLNQSQLPATIIFVDDHSSDNSCAMIGDRIHKNEKFSLIHLPEERKGKKEAIRFAMRNVKTEYCLTIDADTWFSEDFFEQMKIQEDVDMQVRPVLMKGKSFVGHIAAVEHSFFNALNKLLSSIYILSSSGANLLFKKSTFEKMDDFESHRHIASGDDHHLLRAFQKGKAKVTVSGLKSDLVYTASTNSINEYFNQRMRWLGKTKRKTSVPELIIGIFVSLYLIGGFIALITVLIFGRIDLFLLLLLSRFAIDTIVFLNYTIPLKNSANWVWLPFFQLIYPIFFTLVLLGSLFIKPKWKGRKT